MWLAKVEYGRCPNDCMDGYEVAVLTEDIVENRIVDSPSEAEAIEKVEAHYKSEFEKDKGYDNYITNIRVTSQI